MAQPTKKAWETPRLLVLSLEETASGLADNYPESFNTGFFIDRGVPLLGSGNFLS